MSHTLKVTSMETLIIVNSASLFPSLDYMDNFQPLCRRSLKRTEKCLVKRTKIGQTRLIENRVVASFLTNCKPLPSQISIFVSTFARVILSFSKSQAGRKQLQAGPTGLEAGYTPKSRCNVSNIWLVNLITSSLMFTSSN